ncbi:hypothetical protein FC70_GL001495 [Paucilactobacillus oligofermentans DSM 15707 = LMG 22743]|uniref:DUF3021 domain-containing protein n=1 Tax=Paucilactobacillus oligofermentans DSM 15707 = LMG 22743 TaxID=1423778 RepID=A0A0R1RMX7_9LACO|nr:DUF3021 family protein [Paucilactobacillus oligofermentans]KRL54696.1 hypothetical protein FC70_GL001495 [Paucilactobacillus oligofermentans DSM 15707 = LMG 22743]CUS26393.1 DUF3021-containing protein [Paucilactobacillus oligofermentans DSM 15707 = LMG 22743]
MMLVKELIKKAFIGVLIGSTTFVFVLLVGWSKVEIDSAGLEIILIMSAVIGLISKVLDMELGTYLLRRLLHFVLTTITCMLAYWAYPVAFLTSWQQGIFGYLVIYLLILLGFRVWVFLDLNSINKQVKRRKQAKK